MKFPIPQDWDNVSWCRWSVCWPASEGWEGFLRGLITLPQRGWTWDERTGSIIDVQQIGREITAKNLPLEGCIMGCNDDNLADALNNIAIAISLSNSQSSQTICCGSAENSISNSIQNFVNQPGGGNPIPVYGSEPSATLDPGDIPAGYATLEEYDADKCRKANSLINAVIASLRALGAITSFNFTGLTVIVLMAISGVLAVAPPLIPILIGGIIVLAVSIHVLDDAADEIEGNKQEWVCTLYEGDNTEGIIGNLADLIDTLVGVLVVTGPVGAAVKLVILVLLNGDNINKLLTNAPMLGITEIDCNVCNWWSCALGEIIAHDENSITLIGQDFGDFDYLTAVGYSNSEDLVDLEAEVTGWTAPSDHPEFSSAWDEDADLCGGGLGAGWTNISAAAEAGPYNSRTFQHRANSPFTVKYTRIIP
jgi:hypothetical protein